MSNVFKKSKVLVKAAKKLDRKLDQAMDSGRGPFKNLTCENAWKLLDFTIALNRWFEWNDKPDLVALRKAFRRVENASGGLKLYVPMLLKNYVRNL